MKQKEKTKQKGTSVWSEAFYGAGFVSVGLFAVQAWQLAAVRNFEGATLACLLAITLLFVLWVVWNNDKLKDQNKRAVSGWGDAILAAEKFGYWAIRQEIRANALLRQVKRIAFVWKQNRRMADQMVKDLHEREICKQHLSELVEFCDLNGYGKDSQTLAECRAYVNVGKEVRK